MSPIRETAEKIAAPTIGKVAPDVYREIVADIETALRNRDERAAKIVNDARTEGHVDLRSLVTLILTDD